MNGGVGGRLVRSLQSERQGGHGDRSVSPVSEGCEHVKSSRLITALTPALHGVTHWAEDSQPWARLGAPAHGCDILCRAPVTSLALHGVGKIPEFGVMLLLFTLGSFLRFPLDPCPSRPFPQKQCHVLYRKAALQPRFAENKAFPRTLNSVLS